MLVIIGVALVLLGLAVGFVITWAVGVGAQVDLVIGLLLVAAGVVVGFVVEWLIDEAYRKNRELRRLLNDHRSTEHAQASEGSGASSEVLADFLRRRDEELREFRERLAEADGRLDLLQDEFDDYRRTHPDDLTVIKGIGPVYQWKLRDAGVNTYGQLASADPEQLQRMLDVKHWQRARIESWIKQARDWAQRSA